MNAKQRAELRRLCRLWATMRATNTQLQRCMFLSQMARVDAMKSKAAP